MFFSERTVSANRANVQHTANADLQQADTPGVAQFTTGMQMRGNRCFRECTVSANRANSITQMHVLFLNRFGVTSPNFGQADYR